MPAAALNALARPSPRHARRLAWSCMLAAALGAWISLHLALAPGLWSLLALAAALLAIAHPLRAPALLAAVACLAAAWLTIRTTTVAHDSIEALIDAPGRSLVEVEARVLTTLAPAASPRDELARFRFGSGSRWFDVRVESIITETHTVRASGTLRVFLSGARSDQADLIRPGRSLRITGWYSPPDHARNPGDGPRQRWARMSGSAGTLSVSSILLIEPAAAPSDLHARIARAQHALHQRARSLLDGEATIGRAMLAALLLGEDDPALRDTRTAFAATGTAHLLAISGFHLAILCAIVGLSLRILGERLAFLQPLLLAAAVLLILIIVPAKVPVIRAGVMVLGLIVGDCLGRRYDRLTMLAWVSLALFVWRPLDLLSMGAQLSVGITALLLWLSATQHPWIGAFRLRGVRRQRQPRLVSFGIWLRNSFMVCLLCWAFSLPVVAGHTGLINLSGSVTTMLATPVVVLLLAAGYLALIMHCILPGSADWIMHHLTHIADLLALGIEQAAAVPVLAPQWLPPSELWVIAAVVTLAVYVRRAYAREWRSLAALFLLTIWLVLSCALPRPLPRDVLLRIDTLAVSDGSCSILRSGGDAILWDCGSLHTDISPILERARNALGIRHIGRAFLTHADLDHYLALPDAFDLFATHTLHAPEHVLTNQSTPLQALREAAAARNVNVQVVARGWSTTLGSARLTALWPPTGAEFASDNDVSIVMRIDVATDAGTRRVLLTGDIQPAAMDALLGAPAELHAAVLELPHHGSFSTDAQTFVEVVNPSIILQSTGPRRAADTRWNSAKTDRHWYITARDGAAWIEILRDGTIRSGSMRTNPTP